MTSLDAIPAAAPPAAAAAPLSSRHHPVLDGMRGLAVLAVIFHNAGWVGGSSEHLLTKLTLAAAMGGWVGVQLFFVLSGFLITGILLDTKGKAGYFRSFYARRTLRIFPLYYAFLVVALVIAPRISWNQEWVDFVLRNRWAFWLYLSSWTDPFGTEIEGLGHLWSLSVEEQFYLVWPLVVFMMSRERLIKLCAAMVVGTPFIRLVLREVDLPQMAAYTFPIARWDAIALGALLAILMRDPRAWVRLAAWRDRLSLASLAAFAVMLGTLHGLNPAGFAVQVIGQTLIALLSASALVYALEGPGRVAVAVQRLFSLPLLRTIGKYSYGIYVLHMPIHHLLAGPSGPWIRADDSPWHFLRLLAYVLGVTILSFVAAVLSWRFLERPLLDLKDRIAPRPA